MMFISKRYFAWNDMIKTLTIKILIYTLYLRFIVIYRRNLLRSVLITYYCSLWPPCYIQSYLSWFWATGYNRGWPKAKYNAGVRSPQFSIADTGRPGSSTYVFISPPTLSLYLSLSISLYLVFSFYKLLKQFDSPTSSSL